MIIYLLFWKWFNMRGVLWFMYGGLIVLVGLIIFSLVVFGKLVDLVIGKSLLMIIDLLVDFYWFLLDNLGLVSILLVFLFGYFGMVISWEWSSIEKVVEFEVCLLIGVGVEKVVVY